MKILIVNDDGYNAPGINELAKQLSKDHEVIVVGPQTQQSGKARSITRYDMDYTLTNYVNTENLKIYSSNRTPSDCVRVGVSYFFADKKPDLVISGINKGSNKALDISYSGTVAAAIESSSMGCKTIAVSLDMSGRQQGYDVVDPSEQHLYVKAAAFMRENIERLYGLIEDEGMFLNINIPLGKIKGVVITGISEMEEPRKITHAEIDKNITTVTQDWEGYNRPENNEGDYAELVKGNIAITPMRYTLTTKALIKKAKEKNLEFKI